jgi:hypothetical protein
MNEHSREVGWQINSTTWTGETMIPAVSRDTGVTTTLDGYDLKMFTTQVYDKYIGDMETYSQNVATKSLSRNYNLELEYDNGGNFTGSVRAVYADASQVQMQSYVQFTFADGAQWCNGANTSDNCYASNGETGYYFPDSEGGNRIFNSAGLASSTEYAVIDTTGDHLAVTLPTDLQTATQTITDYALK